MKYHRINYSLCLLFVLTVLMACGEKTKKKVDTAATNSNKPHIVFISGEEEYRSEESFPMLANLANRELGAKVTVLYSVDSLGFIDPNRTDHIEGLKALETADLMVIFTRFRNLPQQERKYITDFVESGKPIVGFRTATHAFMYKNDTNLRFFNEAWPAKVFGQQWITHHGHFDDGKFPVTNVTIKNGQEANPIANGFKKFEAFSWLYHVDGGDWKLQGDSTPILMGHSTKSQHEMDGNLDKFSLDNPVAWTKSYTGTAGIKARVFFTTLGHPYDFKIPEVRKIAMNGIYWALGKENLIPEFGVNVALDTPFLPSNSGFGQKFKKNQKPITIP